jgi:hypothetical protein
VRYVGVPRLKHRVIIGVDATDFSFRTGRMEVVEVRMEECVRVTVVLLMLMEMLKGRLYERKRQHEGRQDRDERPHRNILHAKNYGRSAGRIILSNGWPPIFSNGK